MNCFYSYCFRLLLEVAESNEFQVAGEIAFFLKINNIYSNNLNV